MKKNIFTFLFSILTLSITAQTRFAIVQYNKKDVPAVLSDMAFVQNISRDAILEHIDKMGYKSKTVKGFTVFNSVSIKDFNENPLDFYFYFDRKSKQEKDKSLVTLLLSRGNEDFISEATDSVIISKAKIFLNSLKEIVAEYDLELKIKEQELFVKKNEEKLEDLFNDGQKLLKRKREIEADIVQNNSDHTIQKAEIEKQKQIAVNMKLKRKPSVATKVN